MISCSPMRWILLAYVLTSVITFLVYGLDKRAAVRGRGRTPEATLHLLELLGGFAGALLAQHVFMHKRAKRRYQVVFWLIVLLHAVVWAAWLWYRVGR